MSFTSNHRCFMRMLSSMATRTQHLNMEGIVRWMMPFEAFRRTASLAVSYFLDAIANKLLHREGRLSVSKTDPSLPVRVVCSFWHSIGAPALTRAIHHQAATMLRSAEYLPTGTTLRGEHRRRLTRLDLFRAFTRATVSSIAHMTTRPVKLLAASGTD
jgi:hypothetical protein